MPSIYRGVAGVNRKIKEQYRGVEGVNRKIKEQYRVVGGVYRKVFDNASVCLYDAGFINTVLVGDFQAQFYGGSNNAFNKNASNIYLNVNGGSSLMGGDCKFHTTQPVNLSGKSLLCFDMAGEAYNDSAIGESFIGIKLFSDISSVEDNPIAGYSVRPALALPGENKGIDGVYTLDISTYGGSAYLGLYLHVISKTTSYSRVTIRKIYLQ